MTVLHSPERAANGNGRDFTFDILGFVQVGGKCDAIAVFEGYFTMINLVALWELFVPFLCKIQCVHMITCFLICNTVRAAGKQPHT